MNVGKIDRIVRVLIGLVLLALVFFEPRLWFGWWGLIPLATGVLGFCPLYRLTGFQTTKSA